VDLAPLLDALRCTRADGRSISAWSVFASASRRLTLGTKDRETGNPHAPLNLAEGLTVRATIVWDDGRVSRAALERRQVEREPGPALVAARASAYDDPDARDVLGPATFPDVPVLDPGTERLAAGEIAPLAARLAAIRDRVSAGGIRTWSGSFHASSGTACVVTSAGLDVSGRGTSAGWHATLDGEFGAGHSARAPESDADFAARLDRLVATVLDLRRAAPGRPGGVVPVILHPDVVEEYVLGALFHNLEGAAVAHRTSAFRSDQFGLDTPVLREDIALTNNPLTPMRAGAYRFSPEGLPAAPVTFIDRGRLVAPVLELKYARRLGLAPNSAPGALDTVGFSGSSAIDEAAAIARAAGGVLVLNVLGVHTQDFTSGDFSLSAPQVLALGSSGIEGRLRGTISGNLFALLRAADLEFVRFPGEHTPGLLARCRFDSA
jgi:PmbA protein